MKIWLTLDCCYSYLVDGVPGCYVWVSEPTKNNLDRWVSSTADFCFRKAGKAILQNPEVGRLDREIMQHFLPAIDMSLSRPERFSLVEQAMRAGTISGDTSFKTTLHVSPQEWFSWAFKIGEHYAYEAAHAQRVFDPSIPF